MAYTFVSASSQYLSASSSPIGSSLGSITLSIAVNGAAQDGANFFCIGSSSSNNPTCVIGTGTAVYSHSTSAARFWSRDNAGTNPANINIAGGTAFNSTFNRVCATYTAGGVGIIYVNGSSVSSVTPASYTASGLDRTSIGAFLRAAASGYFSGSLLEAAIWDVVLTADEVAALSKGFKASRIRPQSLKFYAPLVRELRDLRGGLSLTNTNSATVSEHARVY